jgi:hypothetical protein
VLEVRDLWPESAAAVGLLDPDSRAYRVIDRLARTYARDAAAAIVPTPGLVELVEGHGARSVTLVTGAIEDHPPSGEARERIRAELGIPADACVFAYVGAHGVVNGLDVLLDAAELVAADDAPDRAPVHVRCGGARRGDARLGEPVARAAARARGAGVRVGRGQLRPRGVSRHARAGAA